MSCWMSSSRVQITWTGPRTCCAICTARTVPSYSRRRPNPPPSRWLWMRTCSRFSPVSFMTAACVRPGICVPTQMSQPSVGQVHRAVHRLHRRVREKRLLVDGVDPARGARDVAARHRRRGVRPRRAFPRRTRAGRRCRPWRASRSGPRPTAVTRRRGLAWPRTCSWRRPPPRHRAGRPGSRRARPSPSPRRPKPAFRRRSAIAASTANFIPGSRVSMPNFALPLTLPALSRRRCGVPTSLNSRGLLERDLLRHGQLRGGIDERAVAELAAGGRVHDRAVLARGRWTDRPSSAARPRSPASRAPSRRHGAAGHTCRESRSRRRSSGRRSADSRRPCRPPAHARSRPCRRRPRAPRRSASAATCRCPGPSRSSARRTSPCRRDRCAGMRSARTAHRCERVATRAPAGRSRAASRRRRRRSR